MLRVLYRTYGIIDLTCFKCIGLNWLFLKFSRMHKYGNALASTGWFGLGGELLEQSGVNEAQVLSVTHYRNMEIGYGCLEPPFHSHEEQVLSV